jgi:hypothetical protein
MEPAWDAGMDPQERGGEGSLLISRARATRTLRRCSLDARSGRPNRPPSREWKTSELGGSYFYGEGARSTRAVETNRATPVVKGVICWLRKLGDQLEVAVDLLSITRLWLPQNQLDKVNGGPWAAADCPNTD